MDSGNWFGRAVMTTHAVRWEDPPKKGTCFYRGVLTTHPGKDQAAALKGRPGVWAVVFEGGYADVTLVAGYIRKGHRGFAYPGHFTTTMRQVGNAGMVYARYDGPPATFSARVCPGCGCRLLMEVAGPTCADCWADSPPRLRMALVAARRDRTTDPARYAEAVAAFLSWCIDHRSTAWAILNRERGDDDATREG